MNDIVTEIVTFFASKLGANTSEEINTLVTSFIEHKNSASSSLPPLKKKVVAKRNPSIASVTSVVSTTSENGACGKCAYVKKKKTGDVEVCGKNAKNEFEGKFYCGTPDKAGHYLTTLKNSAKKNPDTSKLTTVKRNSTASVNTGTSKQAQVGAQVGAPNIAVAGGTNTASLSVLQKLRQNKSSETAAFKVPGTEFFIIRQNRILMNIKTNEAYGILSEDNKTVHPLNTEAIAFLKEKNIFYTTSGYGEKQDEGEDDDDAPAEIDDEGEEEGEDEEEEEEA